MAYQVPMDLIEHARILLRKEAGLKNYNPSDPSFPSLLSVEAVIASFDPSPDCPRCEHCRGKLLRGSQSLICVYCGREPKRDGPPEPLSFRSTIGFRCLMDSLGLDGSEIIEPSEEGKQTNRGWKSMKDEISLSDFLSMEMKWPVGSERFGLFDADDLRNHGKGPLRLAGIDLNHSLSEESENSSSLPIVQAISNEKSIENEAWRSRSIDVKPSEDKIGGTFSAWEADFQAASSVAPIPHDDLESSQPSKLSESSVSLKLPSDDYTSHMDSVFGPLKDFEEGTSIHDSTSHDPHTVKEIETGYRSNLLCGLSSSTVMSSSAKIPGRDDSSDMWDGFTSFTGSGENKHLSSTQNAPEEGISFETWSDFTNSGFLSGGQLANRGLDSAEEISVSAGDELFGPWNDVTNLKHSEEGKEEVSYNVPVSVNPANQKDDGLFMSELTPGKVSEKDEYLSTIWDDFMDSTIPQHYPGDSNSVEFAGDWLNDEGEDTADTWGNFTNLSSLQREKETNSTEIHDGIKIRQDETFDSLNNFTSSVGSPESKSLSEDMRQVGIDISNSNFEQKIVDQQACHDKPIVEDGKQHSTWSDFSSINAERNKHPSQTDASIENITSEHSLNQSWDDFSSSTLQPEQDHTSPVEVPKNDTVREDDVFNSWGDFSSTSVLQSIQQQNSEARLSKDDGLFTNWSSRISDSTPEYQLKVGGDSAPAITEISEIDYSFDSWSEFTSSTTLPNNPDQNSKGSQMDGKQDMIGHDPFDAWSLLMTSSSSQSSNQNVTSSKHVIDTRLFNSSSGNHKVSKFDSSLQPILFADAENDGNGCASIGISEIEALDHLRVKDGDTKSSIEVKQSQNDELEASGQMWKKPIDAETLISQMHDLSFMLESNLSASKIVD